MEDIFDKGEQVVKKPKRKLTDKQKENLRLGRERMAEKRRLAKEKGEVIKSKKQLAERKTMKEITKEKEDEILLKLREKEKAVAEEEKDNVLENVFHKLKIDCLSKAKNVSEYKTIQHHLDGMTMDTNNSRRIIFYIFIFINYNIHNE